MTQVQFSNNQLYRRQWCHDSAPVSFVLIQFQLVSVKIARFVNCEQIRFSYSSSTEDNSIIIQVLLKFNSAINSCGKTTVLLFSLSQFSVD